MWLTRFRAAYTVHPAKQAQSISNSAFLRKFFEFSPYLLLGYLVLPRPKGPERLAGYGPASADNMSNMKPIERTVRPTLRRQLYTLMEPGSAGFRYQILKLGSVNPAFLVELGLVLIIIVNSASLILWTVPELAESFTAGFHLIEYCTVAIFVAEYALRLWTAPEADATLGVSDWRQRWRYVRSVNALVDATALAPSTIAVIVLLSGGDGPSLSFLLTVRLLTRTAKLARYFPAARRLGTAMRLKSSQLLTTVAGLLIALVIAAALMYFAETHAQPDVFPSIPAAMWWSVVTLTTVGYGDTVPITGPGRVLAAVIAVLGIGLFALPAGILSAGLMESDAAYRNRVVSRNVPPTDGDVCPHCGQPMPANPDGECPNTG